MKIIHHRKNCRGCESKDLTKFLDLGKMPLAGGFLTKDQIKAEKKFPLQVYFCNTCALVQILDSINPQVLFEHYFYTSSVIPTLHKHFVDYAAFLKKTYLRQTGSQLLEFGSNDGVLLQNFLGNTSIKTIGIDPSKNITKLARAKGLNVITDYFNQNSARSIFKKYGPMDVVTGSNVFAHVDDIHEFIKAAKLLLKPNGVFIIEAHYIKDLLQGYQYDMIYHEHLCYYSVTALRNIFALENLKIIDVQHLPMHGGGIRVIAAEQSSTLKPKKSVNIFLQQEKQMKLHTIKPFLTFGTKCLALKEKLVKTLTKLKANKKTIVGYGAPGRATIVLNYCHITHAILDYIVDISPLRAGKLLPGVHISIKDPAVARANPPDYFLVLAWNYFDSIKKQEKELVKKGVKFILPFPQVKIL